MKLESIRSKRFDYASKPWLRRQTLQRPTLAEVAARAGVSGSTASLVFSGVGPGLRRDPRARARRRRRTRLRRTRPDRALAAPRPVGRDRRRHGGQPRRGVPRSGQPRAARRRRRGTRRRATSACSCIPRAGTGGPDLAGVDHGCRDPARLQHGCRRARSRRSAAAASRSIAVEAEPLEGVVPIDLDNREATRRGAELLARARASPGRARHPPRRRRACARPADSGARAGFDRLHDLAERSPARGTSSRMPAASRRRGSTIDEGAIAGRALLDVPAAERPTAIIAQSDLLAVGVIRAAEELGIRGSAAAERARLRRRPARRHHRARAHDARAARDRQGPGGGPRGAHGTRGRSPSGRCGCAASARIGDDHGPPRSNS